MVVRWIVHTKDGKTYTNENGKEMWEYSAEALSVERVHSGRVLSILKSDVVHTFFQKTTAGRAFSLFSGESSPITTEEAILGCFVDGKDGPIRIELIMDCHQGNVKLSVEKVKTVTRDGF